LPRRNGTAGGHYQGSDASDEAVPVVGSQGDGNGERIFNLPLPNIQTIYGWRSNRHEDGWKMQHAEILAAKGDEDVAEVEEDNPWQNDPSRLVKAADRLEADMEVLCMLTSSEYPLHIIRASSIVKVVYGFGDVSKGGFGWSINFGNGVRFEFGEWCEYIQGDSSKY
jgi:hypothetical protein